MKLLWMILISIMTTQSDLVFQDHYEIEHVNIAYGSYINDAYMVIRDIETDEIYNEIIVDEGLSESFIYFAEVENNQYIMVLEKYNIETEEYQYSLLLYNLYGEMIKRTDLIDKPIEFYNHHHVLVIEKDNSHYYVSNDLELSDQLITEKKFTGVYAIQHQGQAFVNGVALEKIIIDEPGLYEIKIINDQYEFSEFITLNPQIDIIGDLYHDGYIGSVQIISKGDVFINEKAYQRGGWISNPGIYDVIIYGENNYEKKLIIKIYPDLIYYDGDDKYHLSEGDIFDYPIRIYSNADLIKINDEPYLNSLLVHTGNYLIELIVDEIVMVSINVSLESRVDGVKHQETYEEVILYAFGEVLLNDSKIEGVQHIKNPGTYQIKLLKQNDTYEEIEFYIHRSDDQRNSSIFPYGLLVISLIGLAMILFKK